LIGLDRCRGECYFVGYWERWVVIRAPQLAVTLASQPQASIIFPDKPLDSMAYSHRYVVDS